MQTRLLWPPDAKKQLTGDLMLGKVKKGAQKEKRRRETESLQIASPTHEHPGRNGRRQRPGMLQSTGVAKSWTQLSDQTTTALGTRKTYRRQITKGVEPAGQKICPMIIVLSVVKQCKAIPGSLSLHWK